ncbi:MAG TPA: phosphodiester glycosidase family protein [Acidimicrobiales bacterium]|nr:phosphodiester glycosidase family protein [Acidimicrobiales bacterium]
MGTLVVLAALTPVWASLANALTNPSLGVTLPARGAEWVREHGGASVVTWVENLWYSHHPPRVGGRLPAGAIPKPTHLATAPPTRVASGLVPLPTPAPVVPFASPAIAGEGQWRPAGRTVGGVPAIYETYLRPDAVHTSYVVGVAWMDTRLLRATLYSGSFIPGGGPWRYTAPVTQSAARTLVAAFNAGFRIQDANGGYFTQGKMFLPLRAGGASFVIYRNGSAAIGAWGSEVRMTPAVAAVRQNLSLLVDNGRPVPGLNANDTTKWGFTLGNQVFVWRSGIGITANGALVYVGGPGLNITDLADLLVRAGAVRAMELDINTDWVNFATYRPTSPAGLATPANGTDLLPGMVGTPQRYFYSWWSRDFFTMSARP